MGLLNAGNPPQVELPAQSGPLMLDSVRTGIDEPADVPRGKRERGGVVRRERGRGEGGEGAPEAKLRPGGAGGGLGAVATDPQSAPRLQDGGGEGNSFAHEVRA